MLAVSSPEDVFVANVDVPERYRALDEAKVGPLADSMKEIGLMSPIHVRSVDDGRFVYLVAGRHRLEAARRLGWSEIQACFVDGGDDEFRLWEIAENLHRSELTAAERSGHIAEWIRLTKKKGGEVPHPVAGGRQPMMTRAATEPRPGSCQRDHAGLAPSRPLTSATFWGM